MIFRFVVMTCVPVSSVSTCTSYVMVCSLVTNQVPQKNNLHQLLIFFLVVGILIGFLPHSWITHVIFNTYAFKKENVCIIDKYVQITNQF